MRFAHDEREFRESLQLAKEQQLNVIGITVTGNSNWSNLTGEEVLLKAKKLVELAESLGFQIEILTVPEVIEDLSVNSLVSNLQKLKNRSDEFFSGKSIKIFCETHDSLTTSSLTLFATIQAVRRIKVKDTDEEKVQYFIDDGRHNSFRKVPRTVRYSEVHFIRRNMQPILGNQPKLFPTEVFGPSCDGDDIVVSNVLMPELGNGDLIYLTNVGSDSISMRTSFNGFQNCQVQHFVNRRDHAEVVVNDQLEKFVD